jgi:hypothetical protein
MVLAVVVSLEIICPKKNRFWPLYVYAGDFFFQRQMASPDR